MVTRFLVFSAISVNCNDINTHLQIKSEGKEFCLIDLMENIAIAGDAKSPSPLPPSSDPKAVSTVTNETGSVLTNDPPPNQVGEERAIVTDLQVSVKYW